MMRVGMCNGVLVCISIYLTALLCAAGVALYVLNERCWLEGCGLVDMKYKEHTIVLLGFVGSCLYFSRKAYVYLITGKLTKLLNCGRQEDKTDSADGRVLGYFMYLSLRPFAGFFVGPLLNMLMVSGLKTFGRMNGNASLEVSDTGVYVVCLLAFVGGYAISEIFDYVARLGKELSRSRVSAP